MLVMLKDLFRGHLSGRLLQVGGGMDMNQLRQTKITKEGTQLTKEVKERVKQVLEGRPKDFPLEPSVLVGMVGHRATGGPYAKNSTVEPRRGDIWPAKVEDISLPPAGTKFIDMRNKSENVLTYEEKHHALISNSALVCI